MNKRRNYKRKALAELHKHGIQAQKANQIRFNSGSETTKHAVAKLLVGYVAQVEDYWVSSEVECSNGKEIDVLLWGHPERLTYVVETETGWTAEKKSEKITNYVDPYPPIDDMLPIEVNSMPIDMLKAKSYIREELGL